MEVSVNSTSCVTLPACNGNEQNLSECFNGGPVTSSSSTNHIAGFTCNDITSLYKIYDLYLYAGCSDGDVRFRDQPPEIDDSVKGVVQFCVDGEWKTLCANTNWLTAKSSTIAAPYVICRQLGYSERGITYSIPECDQNMNRCSNQLNAIDEENYHVVESGRCEGVEGAGCDGMYNEASNTKCQCQARCGCVKRSTPHSSSIKLYTCICQQILCSSLQFVSVYLLVVLYKFTMAAVHDCVDSNFIIISLNTMDGMMNRQMYS